MITKILFTLAPFLVFALYSMGMKSEPVTPPKTPEKINTELMVKEQRARQIDNESDCLDYEIEVSAVKMHLVKE